VIEPADTSKLSPVQKRQLLARLLRQKVAAAQGWEPLSYAQRLYWSLERAAPRGVPVNNEGFAWRVRADFDYKLLLEFGQVIVDRHPCLRVSYRAEDGPVQRFNGHLDVPPLITDASGWSPERLTEQVALETSRPFDLANGPLYRSHLFTRGPGEAVVVTTVHHLAMDLWSMVLVMEDLKHLYAGRMLRMDVSLPPATCHYRDFIAWQDQLVRGPQGRQLEDFWSQRLERPPRPLALPTDRPRPAVRTFRGATTAFEFGPELTGRIKSLMRTEQTTLFSVLLAGWQAVLAKWSGQEDFFVATRVAGRSRSEFEGVVGCFANTLPLRADLSGNPTFRKLVQRAGRTVAETLQHQDYPFSLLTQRHAVTRPGVPLCDVCFVLQKPHRAGSEPAFNPGASFGVRSQASTGVLFELGELRVEILPVELPVARYDLELEMLDTGEVLSGWMRYSVDLFDAATVERMMEEFAAVLEAATAEPNGRVSALIAAVLV
jgi:hypothetical protein